MPPSHTYFASPSHHHRCSLLALYNFSCKRGSSFPVYVLSARTSPLKQQYQLSFSQCVAFCYLLYVHANDNTQHQV